jgi:hypothetical protein
MSDTRTPGQIAYEAYCRCEYEPYMARADAPLTWGWALLLDSEHHAWDAAAQAVLEATQAPSTFLYRYRLGQQVRWACEPEAVWRITYRASHEDRADGLRLYYGIRSEGSSSIRMAEECELSRVEIPHA